ncbi:MAG: family 43 glycosylhydrolase [Oscillospiraceae bacterium]|nr:family 43 glycosylhydrolase [Oscillospiraceae bacterium]
MARRRTQILAADTPMGPFSPHSDGPVTPRNWECLDGTLYIENGKPYMVFCHEWLQVHDGEMCAIPLRDDLRAAGDPVVLFRASEPGWADKGAENYVTDGPFLYRSREGELLMLWSSSCGGVYRQAVSRSANGTLLGRWHHDPKLLLSRDGGHGMVFRTFDGRLLFTCHQPNQHPLERPG